jgi:hypothetical protein
VTIYHVLALAALIFGIVAVIEASGRSWAGWGVICLALWALSGLL